MRYVVGVDFDNTITNCDELVHRLAGEMGLIAPDFPCNKRQIRDTIRLLPEGDIQWQRIQGAVYGPRLEEARPSEGVVDFLIGCRTRGIPVFIISHKTPYATYDPTGTNLRDAALKWLHARGFLEGGAVGLSRKDVFFEDTREQKIRKIVTLGCTHFIDDLIETFQESCFPHNVQQILYDPHGLVGEGEVPLIPAFRTWKDIGHRVFHEQ